MVNDETVTAEEMPVISITKLPDQLRAAAVKCARFANQMQDERARVTMEALATELAEYARVLDGFLGFDSRDA
jgi:hypothetical protein